METELLRFEGGDEIPNNPTLPVVVLRGVEEIAGSPQRCAELFASNGWVGSWRDGVFAFHHFHSTSHEALGVVSGRAMLALGGPQGKQVEVSAGDVLVLPAGTGHKRVFASSDFLVVGAYPKGQEDYDLRRGGPGELEQLRANISGVLLPSADPVNGPTGALVDAWGIDS